MTWYCSLARPLRNTPSIYLKSRAPGKSLCWPNALQSPWHTALSWKAVVLAILDTNRDRSTVRRVSAFAVSLLAIGAIAPLAAMRAPANPKDAQVAEQELLQRGDTARAQQRYGEAKVLYEKALQARSSGTEAAATLIRLGTVELATKRFEDAISDFQQAPLDDSQKAGEARMWLAITQERQNNFDAADALYQSALAAEDPNSPASATILELYAQMLQKRGRNDEANAISQKASDVRKAQGAQAASGTWRSGSGEVYRVGGDVSAPILLSKVEPEYTSDARIAKYEGTVLLSVEIGEDGLPRNVQVMRGLGFGLDEKAVEAVTHWKFKPGTKNGQPVAVAASIELSFRLL